MKWWWWNGRNNVYYDNGSGHAPTNKLNGVKVCMCNDNEETNKQHMVAW